MRTAFESYPTRLGRIAVMVLLCLVMVGKASATDSMIDAHAHYTRADAEVFSPADIVAKLDAAGVSRIVVSGSPPDLALRLHAHAPDRVIPFLGIYDSHLGKALWMHDERVPARVESLLGDADWVGLGELHLFAYDARSPVFERLVRIAEAQRLILMLHGDVEIIDRTFEIAPQACVLWAHLGTRPLPDLLAAVLERHSGRNLWVDTSVRDPLIAPDGVLSPEWLALFEAHPERFVVAVDPFSVNRWHRYGEVVSTIRQWTAGLPEPVRAGMRAANAERMLACGGARGPRLGIESGHRDRLLQQE